MQFDSALSATFPRSRRVWVVLALSIVLVVVMSIFMQQSLETLNSGSAWVTQGERVRFQLAKILQTLSDLGSGVTSYQVTHDPQLFEPAEVAARDIKPELAELTALISGDSAQQPLLAQLTDLTQQREKETQQQRDRVMQGDVAGVQAAIAGGTARRIMEAIRQVVAKMQDEQERVLDIHREATRRAHREVAAAIWGAALVAILLLIALTQVMVRDSRRLRRVQEELATTLRSVGDAVIATDDAGAVRFINTVAEQLTGWSSIEARGLPLERVFNIFNEESGASVESPVARVLRENSVVGLANHTVLRARDGKERPIEDSGAPIRGVDGEIRGVVLVFRDATEERAARQALIQSRDALREADRRKDVFLATLSHELRNPLAPIRTATRVLETPNLTQQELERSRSIISRQVRHMAALLDDLLDISRITRGALTLKAEIVDLHGVIEAAIETAQPAISAKRHVLNVEWPQQVIRLEADPVRLTQVVANLLTNAAKYTKPGGQITLGAVQESDKVRIFVRDNGIGIAAELLPKVFDMFSQIDAGQAHSEGGIGIGLALVKGFVELHGGSVEAKSDGLDCGSEFIVTLPGSKAGGGTESQIPGRPSSDAMTTARRRVLIADDNRDGAEIMAMLLDQFGYEVQLAFTGPDAVAAAEKYHPHVAILDIGMPGMNGYEVAQRIRAAPWGESIMLIAVTGWGQDEDKRKAHEAGFNQHLIKPVDPNVLESLMAAAAADAS
jgi:PAS domain S-box-containing protein